MGTWKNLTKEGELPSLLVRSKMLPLL